MAAVKVIAIEAPAAWADAVAALGAPGPLPARTVLVPSERHAHALRRALARSGRGAALAGTRFVAPVAAAEEVLRGAGAAFTPGEDPLRPARLAALFREALPLGHFDLDLLRTARGWDDAFAHAVATLEAGDLRPGDLPADGAHARDLAYLWRRLDEDAGPSLSRARTLAEAAALLEEDPGAWPWPGPVLATATGHEDAAAARFVRALPDVTLCVWRARPATARHLDRLERLFGAEARRAGATPPRSHGSAAGGPARPRERDLLAGHLFAAPEALAAPDRARSGGPDGSVDLEEHAGVEAELEATAAWVVRQVLEARLPLEEIAVLVPTLDPLAQLVADRLERLPFDGGFPVHVAGGTPAAGTAAGARALAVVRALASHLPAEALAAVLPALRLEGDERPHLARGGAVELAYALGTIGGHAAAPEGALHWSARAAAREPELAAALARARADDGDSQAREAPRVARMLRDLRAIRPALDALVDVARALAAGGSLSTLAGALPAFLDRWLLAPGGGASVAARLSAALAPACASPLGSKLAGADALAFVERQLLALRVPRRRFGEPAVYVGTVAGAAGLDFAAVRVVGLCEGALPAPPREDPVLPEALRAALEAGAPRRVLPAAEDAIGAQVHALLAAVRGARQAVALSAPRVDLARTEREPAALLIDAAAALGRPDAVGGAAPAAIPGAAALRRGAFEPARRAAAAFRAAHPVSEADWLDRVARVARELPPAWAERPSLSLDRVAALRNPPAALGPGDGVLGPGEPFPALPGLDPGRPISASALQQLLQCPRMFLMRRILGWEEPAAAPPLRELDAASFGTLLHRVHEDLYRAHGAAIGARERSLAAWQEVARGVADAAFDAFVSAYPLVGDEVRRGERERLRDAVRAFVDHDWGGAEPRRFVAVERPFGVGEPLALEAGGAPLHVHGFIDRLDVEGGATLVRDLKSGAAHPRTGDEAGPRPLRDVQLGLYQLAARALARAWETPERVIAAYVYASGRSEVEERAFRADAQALADATRGWLDGAARLLRDRAFSPTPEEEDCTFCPFRPLCGSEAPRRAAAALPQAEGPLAVFREVREGGAGEEGA